MSREGLARFCSREYVAPALGTLTTLTQLAPHVSHHALNKQSNDFDWQSDQSTRRTVTSTLYSLRRAGADTELLWRNIHAVAAAVAQLIQPMLCEALAKLSSAHNAHGQWGFDGGPGCFHILGLDVSAQHDRKLRRESLHSESVHCRVSASDGP